MLNGNLEKIAMIPAQCLAPVRHNVDQLRKGEFGSDLIETVVRHFYDFDFSGVPFPVRSIVVTLLPKKIVKVGYQWNGKMGLCYTDGWSEDTLTRDAAEVSVRERIEQAGYRVVRFDALPQKQLAVRSGLAEYGRNNIAYAEGMGSFIQIMTFLTDMPCEEAPPMEMRTMAACENCGACARYCPTGAIDKDRYLIRAERCLTYFNEFIEPAPFPEWIPKTAHHSLHGCMICQLNCPENRPYLDRAVQPVSFDEEEVSALLKGRAMDDLPPRLMDKVRKLELEDYLSLIPRNLMAVIQAQ